MRDNFGYSSLSIIKPIDIVYAIGRPMARLVGQVPTTPKDMNSKPGTVLRTIDREVGNIGFWR